VQKVTRVAFGFDGASEGWDFMPTAEPDCTGPSQAGRCALVLDPVHARVTFSCAARRRPLVLGDRSRLSFYYLGDPGRVATSFEVTLESGSFRLFLPDPAKATGIVLTSNQGAATLPTTAGAGPGWHLVTLDIDQVSGSLTLTVEGASRTVAIDKDVHYITSMTMVGDPFAERSGPSSSPSAARIDSMVLEQIAPLTPPVIRHDIVEVMSCPVAVDGGRARGGPLANRLPG
jgi:hypothetical protein